MTAPKPSIVPADALAISIPEAAGRLGIGETTLRAMIDGGILPAVRIGLPGKRGRVVVRVGDLDKLLAMPSPVLRTPHAAGTHPALKVTR
jgi:excisionase family DNA binding protein